jgi:hypothetical protein
MVYKDAYKIPTIISIYPRPTLSSFIPDIVKERAAKLVNIADINTPAFLLNIYRQGNIIFTTSLYKIN